jgi:hypothetical protein
VARVAATGSMKATAARQMRATAQVLDTDHPETIAGDHLRDAARVLEHGSTEGAKRHLDAAMELMTPANLRRHGILDDEGHATAKHHMHQVHRHRLHVEDIEDIHQKNDQLRSVARALRGEHPSDDDVVNEARLAVELAGPKGYIHGWIKVAEAGHLHGKVIHGKTTPATPLGYVTGTYNSLNHTISPRHSKPMRVSHVATDLDVLPAPVRRKGLIAQLRTAGSLANDSGAATELSARTAMLERTPAPRGRPGGPGLYHVKGMGHTAYLQQIVKALIEKRGMSPDKAYRIARGAIRKWMRGGAHAHPEVVAAAGRAEAGELARQARAHAHAISPWEVADALIELACDPIDLVGPKGYEHGWHFVGIPAIGSVVHLAGRTGKVESGDSTHAHIRMSDGSLVHIQHNKGQGAGRLVKGPPRRPKLVQKPKAPVITRGETLYHGSGGEYKLGDIIDPKHAKARVTEMQGQQYAFASSDPGEATFFGSSKAGPGSDGRLYRVEPVKDYEVDPHMHNNTSRRSTTGFRVVEEVTPWSGKSSKPDPKAMARARARERKANRDAYTRQQRGFGPHPPNVPVEEQWATRRAKWQARHGEFASDGGNVLEFFNPYHAPPGAGGGQFTTQQGAGQQKQKQKQAARKDRRGDRAQRQHLVREIAGIRSQIAALQAQLPAHHKSRSATPAKRGAAATSARQAAQAKAAAARTKATTRKAPARMSPATIHAKIAALRATLRADLAELRTIK